MWVYVLNSKVQHGPDDHDTVPSATTAGSLLEAAARLADHSGYSLTMTKEPDAAPNPARRE